jgi:hypothetical protein
MVPPTPNNGLEYIPLSLHLMLSSSEKYKIILLCLRAKSYYSHFADDKTKAEREDFILLGTIE